MNSDLPTSSPSLPVMPPGQYVNVPPPAVVPPVVVRTSYPAPARYTVTNVTAQ
jgi:hypothetical protein